MMSSLQQAYCDKWTMGVKTSTQVGMLLYNTGPGSRSDFVGLELAGGRPRLLLEKGDGVTELLGSQLVSDGRWHTLSVQFNPTLIEVSVDGLSSSLKLPQGGNRYLDLSDTTYLGGLELNKRARALSQGLRAAGHSLKGCLRKLEVDGRRVGIPDAKVTQGIVPNCVWEFPCMEDPCVPGAKCAQQGVDSFRCECEQPLCIKPDYTNAYKLVPKVFSKPTLAVDLEILSLTPLRVAEGGDAVITMGNIDVVLDYPKYGLRDSGLLFALAAAPQHGQLAAPAGPHPTFTLLDLAKDKVRYVHDGSENHEDSVVLELELVPGQGFVLPGYLQGRQRFALHVNVTPVNDPPTLDLPPGATLRLAQGTRKVLPKELLRAEDPDSPVPALVYTVLSQGTAEPGHVERLHSPGQAARSFTQRDVDEGLVAYAHTAGAVDTGRLALQVSDGIETSAPAFLRIVAFPLQLRLVNNTGLVMTWGAGARITPTHLGFESNADDPDLDVRYDVVDAPQFGAVQRLRGDAQWQGADHFTGRNLARDQVRYLHVSGEPERDQFKLRVSVLDVHSPTLYSFRVTFTKLGLVGRHLRELQLNGTREAWLTPQHLSFRTEPLATDGARITYRVSHAPRYGTLQVGRRRLLAGDSFTQQDVDASRARYRLHRKAYSHVRDDLGFTVSAPECAPLAGSLVLLHVPSGETRGQVRATLERLQVPEGGRQSLLPNYLHLETRGITELVYNVTHGPHHGRLDVMDVGLLTELRKNTQYFSSRELMTERVFYVHDDSESRRDSFHFVALSSEEEDFQYVGVFHVDILLKNDNMPKRAIDKVFHIVTGGEKLLTGRDLLYTDADIDTRPSDILYTRRGIQNGGIYKALDPSTPLYEFSQDDLNNRRVLFRHENEEYGKVGLWITDGQFYANGELEVRASPPFISVSNNTGLLVKQGGVVPITAANLSVDTNLNLWGEKLGYELLEGPGHGHLEIEHEDSPLQRFTQLDLEEGHLSYHHDGDTSATDVFRFRASAGQTTTEGRVSVKVYPAIYWEELIVASNRSLHVEESTSIVITPASVQVKHPGIPPTDVVYSVTEHPACGYLELDSAGEEPAEGSVDVFEQAAVDEGRLVYVQATANCSRDRVVVDVTNGVTWLRGLWLDLVVVPEHLYLAGGEVGVAEGGTATLPAAALAVLTAYYRDCVTEYHVARGPVAGRLHSTREPAGSLDKFTKMQLQAGLIQYTHDGSETMSDSMMIVGVAEGKRSVPAAVKVSVSPVNDEKPKIVNNTGLEIWKGATVTILNTQLAAIDVDTPPENLTYVVTSSRFGHLAFANSPVFPIEKFTQAHIDSHKIVFVHTGGECTAVPMTVTDGAHTTASFNVSVACLKVELQLASRAPLHVFPLRRQPISRAQLLATASDPARPVHYCVTRRPALGQLLLEAAGPHDALNFTQQDVDRGLLAYRHTHPFFGLSTNDSFAFHVRADFAEPLLDQELYIDISVSSGGLDQFIDIPSLELDEGGSSPIRLNITGIISFLETHADVESPNVVVQLISHPRHGKIVQNGQANITEFSSEQLNSGDVVYKHDHSDTVSDDVSFSLILEPMSVVLCNVSVPITIRPVNDQPFHLITRVPLVSVVQGQNCTITRHDLLTEDPDTDPSELQYDVISIPSQGALLLISNDSELVPVVKFTQADINAGRLVYRHSGTLQPGTFYFRVWDGHFTPEYTVFNIHVVPLALNVSVISTVMLQQGSSVAFITNDHLSLATNGPRQHVKYNVSRPPAHGSLYVREVSTGSFSQQDLESKAVMYMQTDMTTANDSLEVICSLGDTKSGGLEIKVMVTPLLRLGNFTPFSGARNKLTLDVLDATPLAKWTNSNPVFRVLRRPRLGRIKKIIRSSGERRNSREREVSKFSHEELRSGVIYYVARHISEGADHHDDFSFLLSASIFQPAFGELHFTLFPEGQDGTPAVGETSVSGPRDPVGRGSDHMVATSPNISSDYILIVSMVLGVVLLAMAVIVVVKCRSMRSAREENQNCKAESKAADLRPPSPPRPKRFSSNSPSPLPVVPPLPLPNSIVPCKVIPLEPMESAGSSEIDLNARYPYGVADEPVEEWSSYEASELAFPTPRVNNPMLRRNQYWV
ncbi:chondroitin sulfate proteoglycan 4 isoform X2 [Bacillus rossius redtenbacheri]|uniref:chondroitin sulfate proteoglycan 4 isoform X2 n=1 Tax=Bacillus rossius redtenbacheri TaxID=93214 RepID=UPI002FDEEE23